MGQHRGGSGPALRSPAVKKGSTALTAVVCVVAVAAGFALSSSRAGHTQTATVPVFVSYDPHQRTPSELRVGEASLIVRPGTLAFPTRLMLDTEDPAEGPPLPPTWEPVSDVVVADFRSQGRPAEHLRPSMELTVNIPDVPVDELVVGYFAFRHDRATWTPVESIPVQTVEAPTLADGLDDGFYVHVGTVHLLTNHLGRFVVVRRR